MTCQPLLSDLVQTVRLVVVMRISVDTGMIIVIFISMMYLAIVFVLLFYVGNEWCDLLHKNMTVGFTKSPRPQGYYSIYVFMCAS